MAPAFHLLLAPAATRLGWLLLLCLLSTPLRAAIEPPAETAFAEANRLYEQALYTDAIESYRALLQQGLRSPALHFNLGNAFLHANQPGHAILHYRLALQLAPRDPDLRANLQFARQNVGLTQASSNSPWDRAILHLTLNEWTTLTVVTFWSCLALLALAQLKTRLRQPLRPFILLLALASLLSIFPLTAAWRQHHQPAAIVVVPNTTARFGPFPESQEHFSLPDGAELEVLDQLNDWLQVRDPQGRVGWLTSDLIARLPLPSPPEP